MHLKRFFTKGLTILALALVVALILQPFVRTASAESNSQDPALLETVTTALAQGEPLLLTLEELAIFDGKDGRLALFAVDGVLYDVTNSRAWREGAHNGFAAGRDLSVEIKEQSPHGIGKLDNVQEVGAVKISLTLEQLSKFNGQDGKQAYIAVDGVLYDVTNSRAWRDGAHNGFTAGRDLSVEIKEQSPHGISKLDNVREIGVLVSEEAEGIAVVTPPPGNSGLFRVLGWVIAGLAVLASSPYWLRTLNQWTVKTKDKRFMKVLKTLRPIHKVAGLLLVVVAIIHAILALQTYGLPVTGLLVYLSFVLTGVLGIIHHFRKNKKVFKGHKAMVVISILSFLLHLLAPWALGQVPKFW